MQKKIPILVGTLLVMTACNRHDPILPGVRDNIFNTDSVNVLNVPVPNTPDNITQMEYQDCPYTQKSDNTIWNGDRKIFSGFATNNYVSGTRNPICNDSYVYAGLSTGEFIKLNPTNRQIMWITDVYRQSNMTGGASVLDIVAPAQIYKNYVYVGGLGGAFCKISDKTGNTTWCTDVSTEHPFIITGETIYLVDTYNNLVALRMRDGAMYWRKAVKKSYTPEYKDRTVIVGSEKFDAETGEKIH
jgi:outer membrane protein assembly factor BamB